MSLLFNPLSVLKNTIALYIISVAVCLRYHCHLCGSSFSDLTLNILDITMEATTILRKTLPQTYTNTYMMNMICEYHD